MKRLISTTTYLILLSTLVFHFSFHSDGWAADVYIGPLSGSDGTSGDTGVGGPGGPGGNFGEDGANGGGGGKGGDGGAGGNGQSANWIINAVEVTNTFSITLGGKDGQAGRPGRSGLTGADGGDGGDDLWQAGRPGYASAQDGSVGGAGGSSIVLFEHGQPGLYGGGGGGGGNSGVGWGAGGAGGKGIGGTGANGILGDSPTTIEVYTVAPYTHLYIGSGAGGNGGNGGDGGSGGGGGGGGGLYLGSSGYGGDEGGAGAGGAAGAAGNGGFGVISVRNNGYFKNEGIINTVDNNGNIYLDGGTIDNTGTIDTGYITNDGAFNHSSGAISIGKIERLGYNGSGTYTQTGGSKTVDKLHMAITNNATGTYNLSGSGSISATHEVAVGIGGTGLFNQEGGTNTITGYLFLGGTPDAPSSGMGTYNLSGGSLEVAESEVIGRGSYSVGDFSQTGGTNTVGRLWVGYWGHSSGTYSLSGTGGLSADNEYIGAYNGTGTFNQEGGTNTITNNLYFGYQAPEHDSGYRGKGFYNLSGGSLSVKNEYIGYGFYDEGNFTQEGGTHAVENDLWLGNKRHSIGTYNLKEVGELSSNNEHIGRDGAGTFTQDGGIHTVANTIVIHSSEGSFGGNYGAGTYNLNGGVLTANTIENNDTFNFNGGQLKVSTFQGDLLNTGGTLAPGASPGTTFIEGDYSQESDGTLEIEIGGPNQGISYDLLQISGDALLGGTLDVSMLYGYEAILNQSFDILLAASVSGEFDTLLFPVFNDLTFDIFYGQTFVRLDTAPVPIPGAVWLLGSGLVGLVAIRRRSINS